MDFVNDELATQLARNRNKRVEIGQTKDIWETLHRQIQSLNDEYRSLHTEESTSDNAHDHAFKVIRFARNLVADVPENQKYLFDLAEPDITRLLYILSAWSYSQEEATCKVTRVLTQLVSNMITGNDGLMDKLWNKYMYFQENENVLLRLLTFPDPITKLSALVLILNCIKGSYRRAHELVTTPAGVRVCVTLLDLISDLFEVDQGTAEAGVFDMGYELMQCLFDLSLAKELWSSIQMEDEIITPHQISFLKTFDAYLNLSPDSVKNRKDPCAFLPAILSTFVTFGQTSLTDILPPISSAVPSPTQDTSLKGPPDPQLPDVFHAVIILCQASISILIEENDNVTLPQPVKNAYKTSSQLVENIVDLLRLLERFLPRVLWGKAQKGPEAKPSAPPLENQAPLDLDVTEDPVAFMYVKRDLVRVIGLVAHKDTSMQNRLRACGGIEAILNLCVVDERNPYLREHAIFALKSVLEGNEENQKAVAELEPMGEWDEEGVLKDVPGRTRR